MQKNLIILIILRLHPSNYTYKTSLLLKAKLFIIKSKDLTWNRS
jgi:hypothetical protein